MTKPGVRVTVAFRRSGWQWPLGDSDTVRIWLESRLLAELPGSLVYDLIHHYVTGATLQLAVNGHLREPPPPFLPDPLPLPPESPRLMGASGRRLRRIHHDRGALD